MAEQRLGELLAGPQAGEADLHARHPQLLGVAADQVDDPHRLAHVEHERLAVFAHGRGLETRPTASSTVMKNRVTSGWVTVTGSPLGRSGRGPRSGTSRGCQARCRTGPSRPALAARRALHDHLREPLGGAEDRTGSAALSVEIRRSRRVPHRTAASTHVLGAEHVGLDALARVPFEQRQVLVRGGVEDDVAAGPTANTCSDPALVADVGDDDLVGCRAAPAFSSSWSACRFDSSWSSMCSAAGSKPDLAAQLLADGTARPGDQDPAAGDHGAPARPRRVARRPSSSATLRWRRSARRASRTSAATKDGRNRTCTGGPRRVR